MKGKEFRARITSKNQLTLPAGVSALLNVGPGDSVRFEVTDAGTPALDGKAIRRQVTVRFSHDTTWPAIHLLIYLPAKAKKPVPMFFSINFGAVQNAVEDPGITPIQV